MKRRLMLLVFAIMVIFWGGVTSAEASVDFGTGVDGDLTIANGQTVYIDQWYNNKYGAGMYNPDAGRVPQWRNVNIDSGGWLLTSTYSSDTSGGIIAFKATGIVIVNGNISAAGMNNSNNYGVSGLDSNSVHAIYGFNNSIGGEHFSAGASGGANVGVSGRGGDAAATNGKYPTQYLTGASGVNGTNVNNAYKFGGKGGNGLIFNLDYAPTPFDIREGGYGGGYISITCYDFNVQNGKVDSSGGNGKHTSSPYAKCGGGGGGAGGRVDITAKRINMGVNKIVSNGGTGSPSENGIQGHSGSGGDGTTGAIWLFYETLIGSTTTPTKHTVIDLTPPTGSFTIPSEDGYVYTNKVNLNLSYTDAYGLSQVMVSNYSDFSNAQVFSYPANGVISNWTLLPGKGVKTVYLKVKDINDNWSTVAIDSVSIPDDTSISLNKLKQELSDIQGVLSKTLNNPKIISVQGLNGATATTSSSITLMVDADNADKFTAYRYGTYPQNWNTERIFTVDGLTQGANTITVLVMNSSSGLYALKNIVIFRL